MRDILFYNGKILAENGCIPEGYVTVKDGRICEVGAGKPEKIQTARTVNLQGHYLSPGFIDMHTHGGGGSDFMDGTPQAFKDACRMHLSHGTTTLCPTSMASDDQDLYLFFLAFKEVVKETQGMPHLPGVHLEGPYFSEKQAGAQPPECMKTPFPDHFHKVMEWAEGTIIRWSCAPEVEGVLEMGKKLRDQQILLSIAHTDADLELVEKAMDAGYCHLTHFYSGMPLLKRVNGYRVLGAVEAGYLLDDLYLEIIGDGIHLPPELLKLIFKCKRLDHIQLVTDSMRAAGMPEGESVLGSRKYDCRVIVEDGIAKMPDRSCFAGSVATADRMMRVVTKQAGLDLWDAVRLMTANPAKLLHIDSQTGSIAEGKLADLVVFDEEIHIRQVYVAGEQVVES